MAEYIVDTTDGILHARTTGELVRCGDCIHSFGNMNALRSDNERLKAENAKLRELVDELYPLADYGAMDASELDRAHDLMRELGIEVDG